MARSSAHTAWLPSTWHTASLRYLHTACGAWCVVRGAWCTPQLECLNSAWPFFTVCVEGGTPVLPFIHFWLLACCLAQGSFGLILAIAPSTSVHHLASTTASLFGGACLACVCGGIPQTWSSASRLRVLCGQFTREQQCGAMRLWHVRLHLWTLHFDYVGCTGVWPQAAFLWGA